MALGRLSLAIAIVWCLLVEGVESFATRLFGMTLDGDWFLLFAASDSQEVAKFFSLYSVPIAVVLSLLALTSLAVVLTLARAGKRVVLLLALAFLAYAGVGLVRYGRGWKPLYVAFDTVRSTTEYHELIAAGVWSQDRSVHARTASPEATNLVFVIGESLTSDRMACYGYAKPTTPRLSAITNRLAVLGPVATLHPDTARSLRMMLSRATKAHPDKAIETMPVSLRLAGYRTALVSAQGHWERYCGVEQMIFAACETKTYLCDEINQTPIYDDYLMPWIRKELERRDDRPFALFVHLSGSHFLPGDRVPGDFAADEGLDDYDRTVRYTDRFLAELISLLPERTVLVFVSDHGESVDCPGWRDLTSKSLWRVPLLVYPSSAAKSLVSVSDIGEIWYNLSELWN